MLVCDIPGCRDPGRVVVCKQFGQVHDLCLWHRRHWVTPWLSDAPTVAS